MGCSAGTCAISGLPIDDEEAIRIFLVSESPFKDDGRPFGSTGLWAPRTYPLKAKYDNYGSGKNVEEGPARDVWLEALAYDTVPRGWGDNCANDVPVKKVMTWDELLEALRQRRLRARGYIAHISDVDMKALLEKTDALLGTTKAKDYQAKEARPPVPAGVPTRVRIQKLIVAAGFSLYGDAPPKERLAVGGYLVDKRDYGEVRVRFKSWTKEDYRKDEENLVKLLPHLSEYATMISAGMGREAHSADLLIRPKAGTLKFDGGDRPEKSKSVEVALTMVREDVWQALLHVPLIGHKLKIDDYYRAIDQHVKEGEEQRAEWTRMRAKATTPAEKAGVEKDILLDTRRDSIIGGGHGSLLDRIIGYDALPFVVGLGTHWYLMKRKGPLPKEFLRTSAEFAYIHSVLSATRYCWRPTYPTGPQFGEWEIHLKVQQALWEVTRRRVKDIRKEEEIE